MKQNRLFSLLVIFLVATMACSLTFDLPVDELTTGESVTEPIDIQLPDGTVDVNISFGAGELLIIPGSVPRSITGTAVYNVKDLKPQVEIEGQKVSISTGNFTITGVPKVKEDIKNSWKLQIGNSPLKLVINAGAYEGDYELGGLALSSLEITDGASDVELAFSTPNLASMDRLRYTTGASKLELKGLANANFETMTFRGGAGDFTLDFSGQLKQNATVQIESGLSHVRVRIPETTAARVVFKGGLTSIRASGAWEKSGDEYILNGSGPTLTIYVDMAAGDFELLSE